MDAAELEEAIDELMAKGNKKGMMGPNMVSQLMARKGMISPYMVSQLMARKGMMDPIWFHS